MLANKSWKLHQEVTHPASRRNDCIYILGLRRSLSAYMAVFFQGDFYSVK